MGDGCVLHAGAKQARTSAQHGLRAVWDAIQYMAATGCQWAMLPKDFPPFTTVQYYFYIRLARSLPAPRKELGSLDRLIGCLAADRLDPPHGPTRCQNPKKPAKILIQTLRADILRSS